MNLSSLIKTTEKSKKRVGRGNGSGRGGHTSTRGAKGQKARGSVSLIFEGTKLKKSWVKRLPLMRGKGKFKSTQTRAYILNLEQLSVFKDKEIVNVESLVSKGILPADFDKNNPVKILRKGTIKSALTVNLQCSKSVQEKIIKVGGAITKESNRD